LVLDQTENIIDYIESVKPYRTKIRDYSISRSAGVEDVMGYASEFPNKRILLTYNRVACKVGAVVTKGRSYELGDILYVAGGIGTPMSIEVTEVDALGGINTFSVISGGNYTVNPTNPVSLYYLGTGSGTSAELNIFDTDCSGNYYTRNAYSLLSPTYPWDAGDWDQYTNGTYDHPWDGDMPITYYSASDYTLAIEEQFNLIDPDMTLPSLNLITDPTFISASNWTAGNGWSIASNAASCDGSQTDISDLSQTITPREGNSYEVIFTVENYISGELTPVIGGKLGTAINANGTYTETIISDSETDFDLRADVDFIGDVTYIQVKMVAGNVVYLDFTPTWNEIDAGPYVFVDDKQYYNFSYDSSINALVFLDEDIPSALSETQVYDILPFDGGSFLEPYALDNVPEEFVPLHANEDLVITITRELYRCVATETSAGQIYWLPNANIDTATIEVFNDEVLVSTSNLEIVNHSWDDDTAITGSELVTNGTFDADSDWTKDTNWSIAGGVAVSDGTQSAIADLSQVGALTQYTSYSCSMEVTSHTTGTITMLVGDETAGTLSDTGTLTAIVTLDSASTDIVLRASDDFVGEIDNITVKEVTANDWGWDPCCGCNAPLWDTDIGVKVNELIDADAVITVDYDLTTGDLPDPFMFKYHLNPLGHDVGYRLCSNESGTLVIDLNSDDYEIELDNIGSTGFKEATLSSPGFVWINGELIAYHDYDDSGATLLLQNLVRGVDGTSTPAAHPAGDIVYDAKSSNSFNIGYNKNLHSTNDLTDYQTRFLSKC
jgi:hypothetical protein